MAREAKKDPTELTVEQKLKTLFQLQTMLSKLDEIKTLRGELPLEVQDLEDEIAGLSTRIDKIKAEVDELKSAIAGKRVEIETAKASVEKYKSQQDNVRNNRVYDFLMIVVWLVAVGCFIISRKSQYGKYLKFATVGGLSTFLVLFVYWNVKAESIKPITLTTQLRGYSTSRIVEVCFRYNETPFRRSYNLNQYPNVKLLPEQYDVRLTIKPISANVAKLESITLIPKNRK